MLVLSIGNGRDIFNFLLRDHVMGPGQATISSEIQGVGDTQVQNGRLVAGGKAPTNFFIAPMTRVTMAHGTGPILNCPLLCRWGK